MQTDLNSFNLWEEKYKNKAVVIALNNYLHSFFYDNNCDNYYLLWPFVCVCQLTYLSWIINNPKR